jgi:hypothetical protein
LVTSGQASPTAMRTTPAMMSQRDTSRTRA